jgi:hypothetical protein
MRYQKTSVEMGSKKVRSKKISKFLVFPNVALSANAFCFQLFRNIFLDPFQKIWDQHEILRFFYTLLRKSLVTIFFSYMYFFQILMHMQNVKSYCFANIYQSDFEN